MRILVILSFLSLTACTAAERKDVIDEIVPQLPKIPEAAAEGGPAGAIITGAGILVTVITGYFVRKFIQKRYAKPGV